MQRFRQLGLGLSVLLLATNSFAWQLAILRNGFSIRHERRATLGSVTRLYTGSDATNYVDIPSADIDRFETDTIPLPGSPAATPWPAAVTSIDQIVAEASETHNIDPDFINSVIKAESGFNIRAVSPKGAQGLMQLMPNTASNLEIGNPFDPQANVQGGTRYLRLLLEKYNNDVVKALAAYNAGPERVDLYRGLPPYYETRAYVARIIRDYNRKKLAEQKAANTRAPQAATTSGRTRTPSPPKVRSSQPECKALLSVWVSPTESSKAILPRQQIAFIGAGSPPILCAASESEP